jgi:CspA family cold shock protein
MDIGKIKWLSNRKPFGFIQQSNGLDIFFQLKEVTNSEKLFLGDEITFSVDDSRRGPEAKNISKLKI